MTEQDLKDLKFEKIVQDHYYNYVKGDLTSCDNDKQKDGQWYVMYEFPNNVRGIVTNRTLLKQLVFKLEQKK